MHKTKPNPANKDSIAGKRGGKEAVGLQLPESFWQHYLAHAILEILGARAQKGNNKLCDKFIPLDM